VRFRISPNSAVALAARVKSVGKEFVGEQEELYLLDDHHGEESPYDRLIGDAMSGNGALFIRQDAVEAAWAVVEPVLNNHPAVHSYPRHSWGPVEADDFIAPFGVWNNPEAQT
jgi:glucose-6-phosphate 1-dehydrogenase